MFAFPTIHFDEDENDTLSINPMEDETANVSMFSSGNMYNDDENEVVLPDHFEFASGKPIQCF